MPKKITTLKINNFRGFREFKVENLGGVNLITGQNNSGKSSLLEAIRLLVTEGSRTTFESILRYREERGITESNGQPLDLDDYDGFCSLFTNFPTLRESGLRFQITSDGKLSNSPSYLSAEIEWMVEEYNRQDGIRRLVPVESALFESFDSVPVLSTCTVPDQKGVSFRLDQLRPRRLVIHGGDPSGCIYLGPYAASSTKELAEMWDKVALTDSEDDVIQALQIAAPDITDVTLVGKGGRTAIARSSKFSHPVMLKSFGDGVNRLFALSLSLINAKNGFLVVDEVENGLHHTVMVKLWRIFFKMARKLNVQIFASSHSWDCIEAFQEAAAEDPEEGALVRLTAYEDCIYPTVFSEHDLEIATRQRIEVR